MRKKAKSSGDAAKDRQVEEEYLAVLIQAHMPWIGSEEAVQVARGMEQEENWSEVDEGSDPSVSSEAR